jgi:hypothetical protein
MPGIKAARMPTNSISVDADIAMTLLSTLATSLQYATFVLTRAQLNLLPKTGPLKTQNGSIRASDAHHLQAAPRHTQLCKSTSSARSPSIRYCEDSRASKWNILGCNQRISGTCSKCCTGLESPSHHLLFAVPHQQQ